MKYAFKKVRNIIINDIATKKHKVTLNDLKNFSIKGSQDTVYAEGTDGAKLAAFDVNKVASIEATNGAVDEGYLAMQVGDDVVKITNGTSVLVREEFEITGGATEITLSYKATGATGNEVRYIYKADVNGNPGESFTQNATESATEFAYDTSTKKITLPTGKFSDGDTVIVDYYPKFSEYEEIKNDADKFAMSGEIVANVWMTDLCSEKDVPMQLYMAKGKISGEVDLSAGDQAAVQNIKIEALQQACGSTKNLWTLRKYSMENAEA